MSPTDSATLEIAPPMAMPAVDREPQDAAVATARRLWIEPVLSTVLMQVLCISIMWLGYLLHPVKVNYRSDNSHAGVIADLPAYYRDYARHQAEYGKTPMIGLELGGKLGWLRPLVRWDSFWLLSVAEQGYVVDAKLKMQQNIAYFPLYPALVRLGMLMGLPSPVAAVAISLSAMLLTGVLLFRLCASIYSVSAARWTLWLWLCFPTSMFGVAAYADSCLSLLTILALANVLQNQPLRAGLWAGLASGLRPPGLTVGMMLLQNLFTRRWKAALLGGMLSFAGIGLYFAFLGWQYGDPLLYLKIIRTWREQGTSLDPRNWARAIVVGTVNAVRLIVQQKPEYMFKSGAITDPLLILWCLWFLPSVRKLGWGVLLGTLVAVILPLSTGSTWSIGRYTWSMLPVFIVAGQRLSTTRWGWLTFIPFIVGWAWLAFLFGGGWEVT